jgi:pyrroline-5-carboxylate reductase
VASYSIGFVGAGNMAEALIGGLLRAGQTQASQIVASAPRKERRDELHAEYGIEVTADNKEICKRCQVVVLSVKPQILLSRVLPELQPVFSPQALVVSVASGVTTSDLATALSSSARVVRAMPNTPAKVGAGATALARGQNATDEDVELAKTLFDAVGLTVVIDESLLDAVTGLSGSGPAYVFLILEALADAGVKVGLSRRDAQRLAAQTMLGSAKLLLESDLHPGQLKDMVTSPGGTAIAGLHTLEQGGLRTTLINAVEAATRRARELGASRKK